jgi:nucleoside-diphosphate-sugar epimerase
MEIKDSVFLVTGGTSGLGAASVRMILAGGGEAVIADENRASGEALAAELGDDARFIHTDVTDEASAQVPVDDAGECLRKVTAQDIHASSPSMAWTTSARRPSSWRRCLSPRPRSRPVGRRSVRVLTAWSPPPASVLKIIEER